MPGRRWDTAPRGRAARGWSSRRSGRTATSRTPSRSSTTCWGTLTGLFNASPDVSPAQHPTPTVRRRLPTASRRRPPSGLRVTWLGHSTVLRRDRRPPRPHRSGVERARVAAELGGPAALVRRRPSRSPSCRRSTPSSSPTTTTTTSTTPTICAMKDWNTTFVVPLGVGAHLAYWGVPEARIVELDWWERTQVGELDDRLHARAPRLGADAASTRTRRCGPATRSSAPSTARTSRATPGSSRR